MSMKCQKSMSKSEVVKYINWYFKGKYLICFECQPHFWDAVIKRCINKNADITSDLLPDTYCIKGEFGYMHVSEVSDEIRTVEQLVDFVANDILSIKNEKSNSFVFGEKK